MVNIGDKYMIEIKDLGVQSGSYYLKNSVLDLVVISDKALQGFEKYDPESDYQRGLNDAWEAARKVCGYITDGGMSNEELRNAFGTEVLGEIVVLPIGKVMSILTKYEAKKKAKEEIKVGDEITVRVHSPERTINVIVYDVLKVGSIIVYNTLSFEEGKCFNISWSLGIKKTGRHFPQVAELLDAMKEDGETNA